MNKQRALILLIIMILLVRAAYYFAQPDLNSDHILHMAMAQNFMEGHGFSLKYLNSQNEIYFTINILSPPLYPLFLGLVNFITNNSLLSSFVIQVIVLVSLIFIWYRFFNLVKEYVSEEAYFYFISFLIISTSILNNINTILIFALPLLSLSLYFMFSYLFKAKSRANIILSALFASLLFWTHYGYFFVAFYPALVLFLLYITRKEKDYLRAFFGSFTVSFSAVTCVLVYNFATTGYINYMDNPEIWHAGFFPEHLLLTDPFFVNAFFKTAYFFDYLWKNHHHLLITLVFQLASFLILAVIIILYTRLRKNKTLPFEKTSLLFIPFFVIIALTILFLLYFTLRYHEIPSPGWTHIGETRYLSSVYMSIVAVVVMLIFVKTHYINTRIVKAFKAIMICLIFINVSINIYITAEHWGKYSFKADSYVAPLPDLQELFDKIKIELSNGNQPVFIDNDLTVRSSRISQYAGAAVINSNDLKVIKQFPSNIVFFFILPVEEQYRNEDHQLLKWGSGFNLKKVGKVYNNLPLFKIEN